MSAEQGAREWRFYVQDMIELSEKVLSYTQGLDQDAFIADGLTYDATLRNLQLIGGAAMHVPSEVREAYPDIPWHAMVGTRNRLAHSYLSISNTVIWTVIQDAIPRLLPELRTLLGTPNEDSV